MSEYRSEEPPFAEAPSGGGRGEGDSARSEREAAWEDFLRGAGPALHDDELRVLTTEMRWRAAYRTKTEAIRALGMTPTRYYLILSGILNNPRAEVEYPDVVRAITRLRDLRDKERGGRGGKQLG